MAASRRSSPRRAWLWVTMADNVNEALRESEERYRTLFEQAPVGVFLYDRELRVTACNPRFVELLRSSRERLIGLDMKTLRFTAILGAIEASLNGEPSSYEGPYEATTSAARIFIEMRLSPVRDARGVVIGGMGFVEDVTERVRAEAERRDALAALQRSEARFRQLTEAAPEAIAVVRDGLVLYANSAAVDLLGYADGRALLGQPILSFVHPDDRAILEARVRHLLAEASTARRERSDTVRGPPQEYRVIRQSGSVATVEVVAMLTEYDGATALIGFGRDVTEHKLMQARLLQADRMVSVGTLAAGVAHEINNPLAYLFANLELLALRKLPELTREIRLSTAASDEARDKLLGLLGKIADMVDVARDGADRVRHIVRDLKSFSRGDDEHIEPVDVRWVLDASVNMAWNDIRHRARLVREYGDVPAVRANEARLGQVFLNLLVNAAQALPIGGAQDNTVRIGTRADGESWVVVEVADTGEGIPSDVIGRIFDPFFTTKPVGVGTGLGLWICQGIVTSLGGEISVESAVGVGTTFRVRLPVYQASRASSPSEAPACGDASGQERRGRVLIIDDEGPIAESLRGLLSEEHDVEVSSSGREALSLLQHDKRFDVILCDLMMPDISGEQLFHALGDEMPELARRMIFVTGGAFSGRLREFLESVPNAHLEKPFDTARLRELIRQSMA